MDIKNLLFDLGGVIMNIDRQRCVRSFERLGFADAAQYLGDYGQKGPFGALEAGAITPAEFHAQLREIMGQPVSDGQIDRAFNAFLTGIPVERLRENPDLFDGMVTSFEAKAMKPAPEVFRYACSKLGIRPEETMFLDDGPANVEGARALGFGGLVVPPGREFYDVLKEAGIE